MTTRHCAVEETTNITNTNLSTIWGNRWNLGFLRVPSLMYTDRLNHVRTYNNKSVLLAVVHWIFIVTNKGNIHLVKEPDGLNPS